MTIQQEPYGASNAMTHRKSLSGRPRMPDWRRKKRSEKTSACEPKKRATENSTGALLTSGTNHVCVLFVTHISFGDAQYD